MGVQDDYNEAWEAGAKQAIAEERERCIRLVMLRADLCRYSAKRMREAGAYTTRAIWPPFKPVKCVLPKWEARALDLEACADAIDIIAKCIEDGEDVANIREPIWGERTYARIKNAAAQKAARAKTP